MVRHKLVQSVLNLMNCAQGSYRRSYHSGIRQWYHQGIMIYLCLFLLLPNVSQDGVVVVWHDEEITAEKCRDTFPAVSSSVTAGISYMG